MRRIRLSEFGNSLSTRELGKEVSKQVDFSIPGEIILDFQDVRMINSSFADELVGKNAKELGFDNFKRKVKIQNATENIRLVIRKALVDRLLD